MGAGKTTVGAEVAQRTGATFVDLDQALELASGRSITEIFSAEGEAGFRRLEAERLSAALAEADVLALGGGTPMDDGSWTRLRRQALTVHLWAPFGVLWDRVRAATGRPLVGHNSKIALEALYVSRLPRYREADHSVDATRQPAEVAEEVLRLWRG
jgi:shikimate kinase